MPFTYHPPAQSLQNNANVPNTALFQLPDLEENIFLRDWNMLANSGRVPPFEAYLLDSFCNNNSTRLPTHDLTFTFNTPCNRNFPSFSSSPSASLNRDEKLSTAFTSRVAAPNPPIRDTVSNGRTMSFQDIDQMLLVNPWTSIPYIQPDVAIAHETSTIRQCDRVPVLAQTAVHSSAFGRVYFPRPQPTEVRLDSAEIPIAPVNEPKNTEIVSNKTPKSPGNTNHYHDAGPESRIPKHGRYTTKVACESCHRLKLRCDIQRPCGRCINSGIGDSCRDRPHQRTLRRNNHAKCLSRRVRSGGGVVPVQQQRQTVPDKTESASSQCSQPVHQVKIQPRNSKGQFIKTSQKRSRPTKPRGLMDTQRQKKKPHVKPKKKASTNTKQTTRKRTRTKEALSSSSMSSPCDTAPAAKRRAVDDMSLLGYNIINQERAGNPHDVERVKLQELDSFFEENSEFADKYPNVLNGDLFVESGNNVFSFNSILESIM